MDQTEALVKTIVEGLQEKKGKNIVTVDLTQLSGSICQYMIICEGSTPTQIIIYNLRRKYTYPGFRIV